MNHKFTGKGLKIQNAKSHETTCFSVQVVLDGEPICIASNEGNGGANKYVPLKGKTEKDIDNLKYIALEQYRIRDLDMIVGMILIHIEQDKIVAKKQKNHLVFKNKNGFATIKINGIIEEIVKQESGLKWLKSIVYRERKNQNFCVNINIPGV